MAAPRRCILHTSVVAPSPSPDDHEQSIPLTYLDAMWLSAPPVERVFFYRLSSPDSTTVTSIICNLTRSLSHALRLFFPLAGRLRRSPGTPNNRYELHYQPQRAGVTFTVAELDDIDIDELATDRPKLVAKVTPLVPSLQQSDEGESAVLALQATVLTGSRGIALGVTVHHAACDGAASTRFLHTWASAARAVPAPEPPLIDRSIVRDRTDIHDMFTAPRPEPVDDGNNNFYINSVDADQLLLASFMLSKDHLECIKRTVTGEAARRGVAPPPRCTSTVAAFGFVWCCHCRATKSTEDDDQPDRDADRCTYLYFPIDQRPRLNPPVPEKYLGNCVGPCFASAPSRNEMTGATTDSTLFTACAAVAAAIDEAVRGEETGYWDGSMWIERVMEAYSVERPLSVAGSPRFRVYDVDFGFGRPIKVDIVSVAKTGAISVAESRPGDSFGGIEVGVSLPPDAMDRFATCFADGVSWLSASSSTLPPETS